MKRFIIAIALLLAPIGAAAQALSAGGALGPVPPYTPPAVVTLKYLAQTARAAALSNPRIDPAMTSPPTLTLGTEWATSTAYAVGDVVVTYAGTGASSMAYFYSATTAGTSASSGSGPSGTGTAITDGTVVWSYISSEPSAQYSNAAANSYLWNGGAGIAATAGFISYQGGVTSTNAGTGYEDTLGATVAGSPATTGSRVEFYTDASSPVVRLFFLLPTQLRVLVNGQFVSKTPLINTHTGWARLNINFGSQQMRDVTVELTGPALFGGVDTKITEGVYAENKQPYVTMIGSGDSIMADAGATYADDGFFQVTCDMLGVSNCADEGIGGTGYLVSTSSGTAIQRINDVLSVAAKYPNPVLIDENIYNDCTNGFTSAQIQAAVVAYIQALRTGGFTGPIFELGMYASNNGGGSWSTGLACNAAKLAAVQQVNDPYTFFIPDITAPGGSWFTGTGDSTAPNGTGNSDVYVNGTTLPHPTEAGHYFYAVNLVQAIRNVLNAY